MPPGDLDRALCGLVFPTDENVLVGLDRADDAGVYRISDDLALIQTVDFSRRSWMILTGSDKLPPPMP